MEIIKVSESSQLVRFLDSRGHECEATVDDDRNLILSYHVPGSRQIERTFSLIDVERLLAFTQSGKLTTSIGDTAAVARQQQQNNSE